MSQKSSYLRNSFLIWVFANILGISAAAAMPLFEIRLKYPQNIVVSVIIIVIPISLAQWLALRYISRTSILWVLTFPVGFLVYTLIYTLIPDGLKQNVDDESIVVLTGTILMIGFLVGLLQWLLLRRQFSGSALWILGSSVGIGFSFWFIIATGLIYRSGIISFIIGALIYIIVTGLILLRLLNHHDQSNTNMT